MNNYPDLKDHYEANLSFSELKECCKYYTEKGCLKAANFGGICKKENCPLIRNSNKNGKK
jgi:hypothetical protein